VRRAIQTMSRRPRDGLLVELQGKRGMLARIVASDDKVTLL